MAADVSQPAYRGFLYQSPSITGIWSPQSTVTQAGPRPGVPVPADGTQIGLQATGEQSADSSIVVRCQKAGNPVVDGMGIVWKNTGDTNGYRGWDPPSSISGYQTLVDATGSSDPYGCDQTHAIALQSGNILCAYRRQTGSGPNTYTLNVQKRTQSTGTWSDIEVATAGQFAARSILPCLLQLPDESVLCFGYVEDPTTQQASVRVWRSTDDGAMWSKVQNFALRTPIDISSAGGGPGYPGYDVTRLRAAYANGSILLIVAVHAHDTSLSDRAGTIQYASSDLGQNFDLVEISYDVDGRICPDLVVHGGMFYLFYSGEDTTTPHYRRLGSAYQPTAASDEVDIYEAGGQAVNNGYADADLTAWEDDDGSLYLAMRSRSVSITTVGFGVVLRSSDHGITWDALGSTAEYSFDIGQAAAAWWALQNASDPYPKDYAAVHAHGRVYMFCTWSFAPAAGHLAVLTLGGWTNVCMPPVLATEDIAGRATWRRSWIGLREPDDTSVWAFTGSGTDSCATGFNVLTTTADDAYYSNSPGTDGEYIGRFRLAVLSGGAVTTDDVAIRVRQLSGAAHYDLKLRFSTTGFRIYDNVAGSALATISGLTASTPMDILIGIATDGELSVWYRSGGINTLNGTDHEWILAFNGTMSAGGGSASLIHWGHISAGTAQSIWYEAHDTAEDDAGEGLGDAPSNPTELFPRPIGVRPTYVDDGVLVRVLDGPAYAGNSWTIATRYDFPVENVLPSLQPSPRRGWRSTQVAVAEKIAFHLHTGEDANLENDSIGVYLAGCNWRTGRIQLYDGTTWNNLGTAVDLATNRSSLPYTRNGNTIRPSATSHTAEHYIRFGELVGHTVDLGGGKLRRVTHNTEGFWGSATGKKVTITLDAVDNTEASSGTCSIWSPQALLYFHLAGTKARGIRLVIDAQSTVDNYLSCDVCLPGPLILFAWVYSWGRIVGFEHGTDLQTARDGTRRGRELHPPRPFAEISWTDKVDTMPVQGDAPSDDYAYATTTAGKQVVASGSDAPLLMADFVRAMNGPKTLCVYCPTIPKGTPDTIQVVNRERMLYGRIPSSAQIETVHGDEDSSTNGEGVRTNAIRMEGEL